MNGTFARAQPCINYASPVCVSDKMSMAQPNTGTSEYMEEYCGKGNRMNKAAEYLHQGVVGPVKVSMSHYKDLKTPFVEINRKCSLWLYFMCQLLYVISFPRIQLRVQPIISSRRNLRLLECTLRVHPSKIRCIRLYLGQWDPLISLIMPHKQISFLPILQYITVIIFGTHQIKI